MSKIIEGLYYSNSHEWVKMEGEFAYIGITDFMQHQLGNILYIDLPEVNEEMIQGNEFGAVESTKASSDLLAPVNGIVIEVNNELANKPKLINEDAFANWIIKVRLSNPAQTDKMMDSKSYEKFCK